MKPVAQVSYQSTSHLVARTTTGVLAFSNDLTEFLHFHTSKKVIAKMAWNASTVIPTARRALEVQTPEYCIALHSLLPSDS